MSQTGRYLRPERGVLRSNRRKKRGYLLIFAISALLIAAAAAITLFTYQVVTSPDQFTPRKLIIKGAVFADSDQIRETVNYTIGSNMLVADLEVVCRQVEELPWIEEVSARKIIPDTIELTLKEQQPVAFVIIDSRIMLVDAAGMVISSLTPDLPFTNLPLIVGVDEVDEEYQRIRLKTAVSIVEQLCKRAIWKERLKEVDVSMPGSERIHLAEGLAPIIIGSSSIDEKLTKYLIVEAALRERYSAVEYIDVRFNDQVVVNGTGY